VKRILVALDGSPRAPVVLDAATRLAELTDAGLVLFRAVGIQPDLPPDLFMLADQRLEDALLRKARVGLEQLAAQVPPARIEKVLVGFGTAWDAISRTAREQNADLIVIGSHGYGGLDRVLGTTAAKVVNHADRNVLVVRAPL
jgi:nucleotide-binding universal stress UspA family protein